MSIGYIAVWNTPGWCGHSGWIGLCAVPERGDDATALQFETGSGEGYRCA